MTWDFIVAPNSLYPPHIGHVAAVMHARGHFLAEKAMAGRYRIPDVTCRWGLVHDLSATPENAAAQLHLLEWMGYPPEFEVMLRDFEKVSDYAMCRLLKMERRVLDLSKTKAYLLLVLANARTHVRGLDLVGDEEGDRELAALLGLPFPTLRYAPLLVDSNGDKICSSRPDHERFRVDFKKDPRRLIEDLMDLLMANRQSAIDVAAIVLGWEDLIYPISAADKAALGWFCRLWNTGLSSGSVYTGCVETPINAETLCNT